MNQRGKSPLPLSEFGATKIPKLAYAQLATLSTVSRSGHHWTTGSTLDCLSRTRLSDFTFTFHFHALEKAMAPHSSTLAWKIPRTEEPGKLQSMGSLRVRHDWVTSFHFSLSCIGEGNGNPLQCSCLESPRNRGAWWAAVYGVAQSRTQLKRLSSSSSSKLLENCPFKVDTMIPFYSYLFDPWIHWNIFIWVSCPLGNGGQKFRVSLRLLYWFSHPRTSSTTVQEYKLETYNINSESFHLPPQVPNQYNIIL